MQNWLSSAVILIALFSGFIALVFWAWSKARRPEFNAASQLPLQEDNALSNDNYVADPQQKKQD